MKLYYHPGACSLAPHIALREAGLPFELALVDFGPDYLTVNPKNLVPALRLPDGQVLTETPAVLMYIAEQAPAAKLAPAAGMARHRCYEWLSYISSELHKGYGNPKTSDETPQVVKKRLTTRFGFVNAALADRSYLLDDYSVADIYLFTVMRWMPFLDLNLPDWPALKNLDARVAARTAVAAALAAESP